MSIEAAVEALKCEHRNANKLTLLAQICLNILFRYETPDQLGQKGRAQLFGRLGPQEIRPGRVMCQRVVNEVLYPSPPRLVSFINTVSIALGVSEYTHYKLYTMLEASGQLRGGLFGVVCGRNHNCRIS